MATVTAGRPQRLTAGRCGPRRRPRPWPRNGPRSQSAPAGQGHGDEHAEHEAQPQPLHRLLRGLVGLPRAQQPGDGGRGAEGEEDQHPGGEQQDRRGHGQAAEGLGADPAHDGRVGQQVQGLGGQGEHGGPGEGPDLAVEGSPQGVDHATSLPLRWRARWAPVWWSGVDGSQGQAQGRAPGVHDRGGRRAPRGPGGRPRGGRQAVGRLHRRGPGRRASRGAGRGPRGGDPPRLPRVQLREVGARQRGQGGRRRGGLRERGRCRGAGGDPVPAQGLVGRLHRAVHRGRRGRRGPGDPDPQDGLRADRPGRLAEPSPGAGAGFPCGSRPAVRCGHDRRPEHEAPFHRRHRGTGEGPGPGHAAGHRDDRRRLGQAPGRRGLELERGHPLQHAPGPPGRACQAGRAGGRGLSRSSSTRSPSATASRWATRGCGPAWSAAR